MVSGIVGSVSKSTFDHAMSFNWPLMISNRGSETPQLTLASPSASTALTAPTTAPSESSGNELAESTIAGGSFRFVT
jgi:hypothetical protein